MKKLTLSFLALVALGSVAFGGEPTVSKETVPPPCPEWYANQEWNVNLWGTYVFTGNEWRNDEYLAADHAWGGGADVKYFFHRYFGIGLQGWAVNARRETFDLAFNPPVFANERGHESRAVGAFLGTFTLRLPLQCSRFAPYLWGGGGVIFGGGDRDEIVSDGVVDGVPLFHTEHHGTSAEGIGQIGGGFEVRFTRNIGWTNDFSWNFVTRDNSDFGMARTGINFAF